LLLLMGLLMACAQSTSSQIQLLEETETALLYTPSVARPSLFEHTQIVSSTPELALTPTPELLQTTIPTPTFQICSPLAWETIPELWEIVSDPYAPPPMGRDERHQGVDFSHWSRKGRSTIQGEPVQSILPGRVAAVVQDRLPYGNMVIVETVQSLIHQTIQMDIGMEPGESLYVLYAHFDEPPIVDMDDTIPCGMIIGAVGMTGYNVVNAHLHVETRLGPAGISLGTMAFYTTSATQDEMDTYQRWRTSGEFRHFDPLQLFESYLKFAEAPMSVQDP
jgi:murein DD-endopeptidase MepM/ murein hydrolase activator NlpD